MADLTGKTIANGYPNLVTVGATTDDNPTSGTLENGKGNNLTSVTFDGAVVVNESGGNNDFRVEGDTDANLLFVDASTDRVGIGTNAPALPLDVDGEIRASGGILFGTDTAAANALDDYEEGTWTPTWDFATTGDLSVTYTEQVGTYTKIGDVVVLNCTISVSAFTYSTASGNLQLKGLPYSVSGAVGVNLQGWTKTNYTQIQTQGIQSYLQFLASGSGQNRSVVSTSDIGSGSDVEIRFSGTFKVS